MISKRILTLFLYSLFAVASAYSRYVGDVNNDGSVTLSDVTSLINLLADSPSDNYSIYHDLNCDGTLSTDDITELVNVVLGLSAAKQVEPITIVYTNEGATYTLPAVWASHVSISTTEGFVSVANTNTTDECTIFLSGSCSNGSFTYTGNYKATIILNGLSLTNQSGAAIDIQCGKRIDLELAEGTENTLIDGSDGSQKAALYCKGHLEIGKAGSLTVTGNSKHAISAKEYIKVKQTTGNITINGAASDGIHCGQYFQMNGGTVTISGVEGDGIQAEITNNETDEQNGQLLITGGTLDINLTGSDVSAMKSDSLLSISGGDITITSTGDDVKAIKSKTDICITGGSIGITQSGGYLVTETTTDGTTTYDPSYTTGIKASRDITITDGTITITTSALGARGINADGNMEIADGTVTITNNGAGGVLDTSGETPTSTSSYKFYISLPATASSSSGGMWGGGSQSNSTISWGNPSLYKSDGTLVATLTNQVSVGSGSTSASFFYYDFGTQTSGSYYITATYTITSSGGMGGPQGGSSSTTSGTYTSSSLSLNLSGSDVFYAVTATRSGQSRPGQSATYSFSINNVTSTYSGATIATEEGDTYSASCLKSDGDITLAGGTLTLSHSGSMSKGVKADGMVKLSGASVTDYAIGTYNVAGTDISYCTAVKCGSYEGTSGSLNVEATGQASRGISSDGTINITGGEYDFTLTGDGLTNPNDSSDGIASVGMKSDGNMSLAGGYIAINNSAKGGKGIKVGTSEATGANGATLTIGQSGFSDETLTLDVNTSGQYIATESSGGGQFGGPTDGGFIGSTKAIKVMGPITVNSGTIHLSTISDGAEGLESKHTITFNGGTLESDTYDDAINAGSTITINNGNVWAHASNNDAIDSNASSGTNGIVINGGVVIGTSTTSPEEAFDCDNANFVLNGGVVIGVGGAQGGGGGSSTAGAPSTATQAYAIVSSVSLTQNTYVSVKNSSGTVLCSYKQPNSFSSGGGMGGSSNGVNILVSHPNLSGSGTVVYNSTAISGGSNSLWNGVYTTGATLTGGTSKSITASK